MAENNCGTCNQSFNSDRELQEHQQKEHSGNQGSGKRPAFPEPGSSDQTERREKIA